jgi:hypothetical protein
MAPEFAGREDNVQKFGPIQIVEVLCCMFDLVRGSRAFMNEAAYRFRDRGAQSGPFAKFVILVEPGIARRYEVLPAESLAVESRGCSLATIRYTARFCSRHIVTQGIWDIRIRL